MLQRRKAKDLASYQFYKFDKWLLIEDKFKKLSANSKLLYMILKDREEISLKNAKAFTDEKGCLFIYFDQVKASELLGISRSSVMRAFKDLQEYGLIESVRQGLGKPNRIYILDYKVTDKTLKYLSEGNEEPVTESNPLEEKEVLVNQTCTENCAGEIYTDKQREVLSILSSNNISNIQIKEALELFTDTDKLNDCINKCEGRSRAYNYLRAVYKNNNNQENVKTSRNNKFDNFDATFTKYTEDELNEMIEESQVDKYGVSKMNNNNMEVGDYGEEY